MGTNNFYVQNTSCVFCSNDGTMVGDVMDDLAYLDKVDNDISFIDDNDIRIYQLRSYPSSSIGRLYSDCLFEDIDFSVELILITTSGYYSGFNFDYIVNIEVENEFYDDVDDLLEMIEEYVDDYTDNPEYIRSNMSKLEKLLENKLSYLSKNYENVLMRHVDKGANND